MADSNLAEPLVTPYPAEDHWLILAQARRLAKLYVKEQLRDEGRRVSLVPPVEITATATELLAKRPDIYREAVKIVAQHPEWRPRKRKRRSVT